MIPLVLSIDDDRSSQILMAAHLKDVNFCRSFVSKANGQEALDYLKNPASKPISELWPDLILLDINMPVLDGWSFLDALTNLHQRQKKIPPIVMVSATNTAEDISRAKNHPLVSDLIVKPVSARTLEKLSALPELLGYFKQNKNLSAHTIAVS